MPLLLLPPRYSPDSIALRGAALEAGWEVERLASWRVPEHIGARGDLVFYGEPLFAAVVAAQLGVALLEPPLDWTARLPERFLRRGLRFTDLGAARDLPGPLFVKPADDKSFTSRVYGSGAELPAPDVLPDGLPVVVGEPVAWELEVRCFVADRRRVTTSLYLRRGALNEAPDGSWPWTAGEREAAHAFLEQVLTANDVALPPGVVVDVGLIEGRGWAVVEANAAWGSGIYGCEPSAVLEALALASAPRAGLTAAQAAWVLVRA